MAKGKKRRILIFLPGRIPGYPLHGGIAELKGFPLFRAEIAGKNIWYPHSCLLLPTGVRQGRLWEVDGIEYARE
jgi:hypothetical protein